MAETTQERKDRERQEDLAKLRGLRPIDDDFMRCIFRDNIPLAQLVLRIVTGMEDLTVINLGTQKDLKRLVGARSICLDAYADDSTGKKYDLEFEVLLQRDASPVSDIHSKAYCYVEETIRAHFPDVGVAPYLIMGGTDCRHFHALTDTALRFAPVRCTNAQNAACHAVDENVTLSALAEGVRLYKRFLKNYPG